MTEEEKTETTDQTTTETTDESKKTETQENDEKFIPKSRFDEINEARKKLEAENLAFKEKEEKAKKEQLIKEKKFEELAETLTAENQSLKLAGIKRDLIQEAINNKEIKPELTKMIVGTTEEEIKSSIEEAKEYHKSILSQYENERTASDDSGASSTGKKIMSKEEYQKLLKDKPDEANEYLRKWTEQQING